MSDKLPVPTMGDMLKMMLEDRGISMYRLHKATGIPWSNISKLCNGSRPFTWEKAELIGAYLDVRPGFLMDISNDLIRRQHERDATDEHKERVELIKAIRKQHEEEPPRRLNKR